MVPARSPKIMVESATLSLPRFVRIPITNTLATGGESMESTMEMASNMLSKRPINGDQEMASKMTTRLVIRPARKTFLSGVAGLILFRMSMETNVPTLFSAAEMVLIRAASKAAVINPTSPVGSTFEIITNNVSLGSTITSEKRAYARIPGNTIINTGNIFRNPANRGPFWASFNVFAPSTFCTMV